jgi:glycosyltransferase involved in cell wall biosynthesis
LPLRLASFAGLISSVAGLVVAALFVIDKLSHPELPSGWASMIVSLFIIGGIQLFALGMIGEYLGRLFLKDTGRPQFVIRDQLNCEPESQANTSSANPSRPSTSRPSAA